MIIGKLIDSLVKIALLGAIAYGVWYWQGTAGDGDKSTAYAELECRDAIESRFDVSNVSVFKVSENSNGFVVRATGSRADGTPVRFTCLANPSGSVRDITLEHR